MLVVNAFKQVTDGRGKWSFYLEADY